MSALSNGVLNPRPTVGLKLTRPTGGVPVNPARRPVTQLVVDVLGITIPTVPVTRPHASVIGLRRSVQEGVKDVRAMGKEATKILQAEHTDMVVPFEGQTSGKFILVGVESFEGGDSESSTGGAHKVHLFGSHGGVGIDWVPGNGVEVGRQAADRQ